MCRDTADTVFFCTPTPFACTSPCSTPCNDEFSNQKSCNQTDCLAAVPGHKLEGPVFETCKTLDPWNYPHSAELCVDPCSEYLTCTDCLRRADCSW